MHTDALDIREFYASPLGQVARRHIRRRIRTIWPDLTGQIVVGIGYTTPYLRPFQSEAERLFALMPASQGVVFWPAEGPGLTALSHEDELPLPSMSVDRVLLVHSLESTEHLRPMLQEIWRVLNGSGRLLVVVPNRRGLWARTDRTPFGHGIPYSASQIKRTLREAQFVPEGSHSALFVPPVQSRFLLRSAPVWEEIGSRWCRTFSGVHLVEASKQLYAMTGRSLQRARKRALLPLPDPAPVGARPFPNET